MYCEEMDGWLAEERLEEARSQARLALINRQNGLNEPGISQADAHHHAAINSSLGEMVQVVEDEDEVTTIRRPVLPDVRS